MKTKLEKKDIITYLVNDEILIQSNGNNITLTKEAIDELITDCRNLGVIEDIKNVFDNKTKDNITENNKQEIGHKNIEKSLEEAILYTSQQDLTTTTNTSKKINFNKKNTLTYLCLLISFVTNVYLIFLLSKQNKQTLSSTISFYKENKNINGEVFTISLKDTTENFNGEKNIKKQKYDISIKSEKSNKYGMWPIIYDNGIKIVTNHQFEFDDDNNNIGFYIISDVFEDMLDALNKISQYKKQGITNSGILLFKKGKYHNKKYYIYTKRSTDLEDIKKEYKNLIYKSEFIQVILD